VTWDTSTWKRSTRLLLGIATIWPIIYIVLFVTAIFSGIFVTALFAAPAAHNSRRIDLIQLEKKIQNGEIKELRITSEEIRASDRAGGEFYASLDNASTREEIIRQAQMTGPDGAARVSSIEENSSRAQVNPLLPVGFFALFAFHLLTMLLMFVLMPLYIILPLKNQQLDQNMRLVWVILACTMGVMSDVVYWYLHIWRRPSAIPPSAPQFTS
jgi:hypothetical protein